MRHIGPLLLSLLLLTAPVLSGCATSTAALDSPTAEQTASTSDEVLEDYIETIREKPPAERSPEELIALDLYEEQQRQKKRITAAGIIGVLGFTAGVIGILGEPLGIGELDK